VRPDFVGPAEPGQSTQRLDSVSPYQESPSVLRSSLTLRTAKRLQRHRRLGCCGTPCSRRPVGGVL